MGIQIMVRYVTYSNTEIRWHLTVEGVAISIQRWLNYCLAGLLLLTWFPLAAQEAGENEPCLVGTETETCLEESSGLDADGSIDDADGSIDDAESSIGDATEKRGWEIGGDFRLSFVHDDIDITDEQNLNIDQLRARWRLRSSYGITERLRISARLAGLCSTNECQSGFYLEPETPTPVGIKDGQVTLDELFFHWFRTDQFDLAIGRLQTKFVTRGGVYAKSLDRNDSNNLRINWTDGIHAVVRAQNGWATNLILQYNSPDGSDSFRRLPLDFTDSGSRTSYFLGFENNDSKGQVLQRGLDISYLPDSLLKDGIRLGRLEDYWGLIVRGAARWPVQSKGMSLRVSAELGYAPETQTREAAGLAGDGDVDGMGWAVTASLMNFLPRQSLGINYAHTDAGWLLSPQYGKNEELFEIRYMWRRNQRIAVDIRGRWRKDIEPVFNTTLPEEFDFYIRLTWGFKGRGF